MFIVILITTTTVLWIRRWWAVFVAVAVCAVIGGMVAGGPGAFIWGFGAFLQGWLVFGVMKLFQYARKPKG